MNLDRQLREALARKNPPPDLADRVVARIASEQKSQPVARPERRAYLPAAPKGPAYVLRVAAVLVVFIAIGFGVLRQREASREHERAKVAARQLMTALQIASETLNDAQRIVQRN